MTTMTEDEFNTKLPLEIRRKIIYYDIIGRDEPTLDYCQWVCKEWNLLIKRSVWQSPTKEWGVITKAIIETWVLGGFYPSHQTISHAKDLEMDGILPTGVMKTIADGVKSNVSPPVISFDSPEEASPEDMTVAASLAHLGVLGTLERMWLRQDHLASIPSQHLATMTEDKFNKLPLEIRTKILYYAIVGQEDPTLDYCRWVCKEWNL